MRCLLCSDFRNGRAVLHTMIQSIQRWIIQLTPHRMAGNKGTRGLFGMYLNGEGRQQLVSEHGVGVRVVMLRCSGFEGRQHA